MISYWRREFQLPNLPFFYVLLAAGHTALLREAQYLGAGAIPHTAFASAVDLGANGSEFLIPGHPPRKQVCALPPFRLLQPTRNDMCSHRLGSRRVS
jgi:hypothetical protein